MKPTIDLSKSNKLRFIKSKNKLQMHLILIFNLVMFLHINLYGYQASNPVNENLIRPQLDVRILNREELSNFVFPGARFKIKLLISNTGVLPAESCWLKTNTDSGFLIAQSLHIEIFTLNPGESKIKEIPVEVRLNAPKGLITLEIDIEEANGYNLFPKRVINFLVRERPNFDLAVVDAAIKTQAGKGYFERFEDVEIVFRIQNCTDQPIFAINAFFEPLNEGITSRFNPNLQLGSLTPGELWDIRGTFSTGLTSDGIPIRIRLETGTKSFNRDFKFDFLVDYKSPEELVTDGCNDFLPSLTRKLLDEIDFPQLSPLPSSQNKMAVIIANKNYKNIEDLSQAITDADYFSSFLISYMGYREENIHVFYDLTQKEIENLYLLKGKKFRSLKRNLGRSLLNKELLVYIIGHAGVNYLYGNVYFLPADYPEKLGMNWPHMAQMFDNLKVIKEKNRLVNVTMILNLNYLKVFQPGGRHESLFSFFQGPQVFGGYSAFFGTLPGQTICFPNDYSPSYFSERLIQGLKGGADLNLDGEVTAFELNYYLSDLLSGISPDIFNSSQKTLLPLFLGENRIMIKSPNNPNP